MRKYGRGEVERFLRAMDDALPVDETIVIIGGVAVALRCSRTERMTKDIDSWGRISPALGRAAEKARQVTGLTIPLEQAAVADGPFGFEERLVRTMPRLGRLKVMLPEKHDLALMKIVRGDETDVAGLAAAHHEDPLDYEVLVRRYEEEMGSVVGDPSRLRLNMLRLIEELFPERIEDAERRLKRAHAKWKEVLSPLGNSEIHGRRR
jgi:hypothetical protein